MERNNNIDLIKIISCIFVIGLHSFFQKEYRVLAYLCSIAVPMFMMVSGYLFFQKSEITWKYIVKKCSKLVRFTLSWALVLYILKNIFNYIVYAKLPAFGFIKFCENGLFQRGLLAHFWYFAALVLTLIAAFFVYKFIIKAQDKEKRERLLFISWLGCAMISLVIEVVMFITKNYPAFSIPIFLRVWCWLNCFLLGGLIPQISKKFEKVDINIHMYLTILITIITVGYQYYFSKFIFPWLSEMYYDSIGSTIWRVLVFTYFLRLPLNDKMISVTKFLAPLTLSVFVIHLVIMRVLLLYGFNFFVQNPMILFLTTIVTSSITALLLYYSPAGGGFPDFSHSICKGDKL